ncbi:MAG: glycosyltransferase family 4 protein [Clostridia bacterium]|nr:glycosyltransferase family 4 protein [Clostridia bacterium]
MKILIYENSWGFASYTHQLCNAIVQADDKIEVIYATSSDNEYIKKLDERIKVLAVLKTYDKPYKKNSFRWMIDRISVSLYNILQRSKILKEEKPDIVSIQSTIPILDQYFVGKIKARTIQTVHDVIVPIKSLNWSKSSLRRMYNSVDELIVHSQTNKAQLCSMFNVPEKKVHVIHHGTPTTYREINSEVCKEKLRLNNGKKTLLFYGLIRQSKGLDILIQALEGLQCNLVIAGSMPFGEEFEKYERLIEKHGIDCRKFIEYISDEFTEELYQACDIVVLPYIYFYSQSGVFMQAIQYRKPVVATDVSCFKEYIDKYGFGIVCEANNVEALRKAIEEILSSEDKLREYTNNAYNAAAENSWEKSAELHIKLFEKKLNNE